MQTAIDHIYSAIPHRCKPTTLLSVWI